MHIFKAVANVRIVFSVFFSYMSRHYFICGPFYKCWDDSPPPAHIVLNFKIPDSIIQLSLTIHSYYSLLLRLIYIKIVQSEDNFHYVRVSFSMVQSCQLQLGTILLFFHLYVFISCLLLLLQGYSNYRSCSTVLNKSTENEQSCLVPDFRGKVFSPFNLSPLIKYIKNKI